MSAESSASSILARLGDGASSSASSAPFVTATGSAAGCFPFDRVERFDAGALAVDAGFADAVEFGAEAFLLGGIVVDVWGDGETGGQRAVNVYTPLRVLFW